MTALAAAVRFRLMPGFRARNEGDPVRMGDSVILQSAKAPSMYLHCDTKQNESKPFKTPEQVKRQNLDEIDDDVRDSLTHLFLPLPPQYPRGAAARSPRSRSIVVTRAPACCPPRSLQCLSVSWMAYRAVMPQDNRREVNFAGEATRFKIVPVASWTDIKTCALLPTSTLALASAQVPVL